MLVFSTERSRKVSDVSEDLEFRDGKIYDTWRNWRFQAEKTTSMLFIGVSLSWLPVLASRRILAVSGVGLMCSVVAGGALEIVWF